MSYQEPLHAEQLNLFHGDCNIGLRWWQFDKHPWHEEKSVFEPGSYGWGYTPYVCLRCGARKAEGIAGGP